MFYKNIAEIYALSRPPYPQELFNLIISHLSQGPRQHYVDLGCGTGELLLPLSGYFKSSIGVDPDEDMLRVATKKMKNQNISNVMLIQSMAEDYLTSLSKTMALDLVTAGRSFHWMKQDIVVKEVYARLIPGGLLVTLGEMGGIWTRESAWAQEVRLIIFEEFPHKPPFTPVKGCKTSLEIIKKNLEGAPFSTIEDFLIESHQQWTIDMILNLFYSASCFLEWLGNDKSAFESKVKKALVRLNPSGVFEDTTKFGITCCTK